MKQIAWFSRKICIKECLEVEETQVVWCGHLEQVYFYWIVIDLLHCDLSALTSICVASSSNHLLRLNRTEKRVTDNITLITLCPLIGEKHLSQLDPAKAMCSCCAKSFSSEAASNCSSEIQKDFFNRRSWQTLQPITLCYFFTWRKALFHIDGKRVRMQD